MNIFSHLRAVYDNASFQKKLLVSYLAFMCLPVLALTWVSIHQFEGMVVRQAVNGGAHAASVSIGALENVLAPAENTVRNVARQSQLREILSKDPLSTPLVDQIDDLKELSKTADSFRNMSLGLDIRLYINDDFRYSRSQPLCNPLSDFWACSWSDQVLTDTVYKMFYYSDVYTYYQVRDEPRNVLTVFTPIRDSKNVLHVISIVGVDIPVRQLTDCLQNALPGAHSAGMLFGADGQLLAATEDVPEELLSDVSTLSSGDSLIRNGYVLSAARLASNGWRVAYATPLSETTREVDALRLRLFLLVLLTGATVYLMAWRYARHSMSSILSLQKEMGKVQQGDYTAACIVDRCDEIGDMQVSFNTMVRKTRALMDAQQEMSREMRALELRVLQGKINPHFLYNTLDLISWSADDPERVRTIVVKLSQFYRLSLSGGSDFIPLKDEFEHVRLYMDIQNIRFQSAIPLDIQMDPAVADYPVMKLLLQPIVENSIVHGLQFRNVSDGHIWMRADTETLDDQEYLNIIIADNGVGLNNRDGTVPPAHTGGYGLKNIQERLHMYYGPLASLTLENQQGARVTIRIPLSAVAPESP